MNLWVLVISCLMLMVIARADEEIKLDYTCQVKGSSLKTFVGLPMNYDDSFVEDKKFIAYADKEKLVAIKYKPCETEEDKYCRCAFFVQMGSENSTEYMFIDRCSGSAADEKIDHLEYFSTANSTSIEEINCEGSQILNEEDENEWNKVDFVGDSFQCALSSDGKAYLIRVTPQTDETEALTLKVELDQSILSIQKTIHHSQLASASLTGGLCGSIKSVSSDESCYTFTEDEEECESDTQILAEYWNVDNLNIDWDFTIIDETGTTIAPTTQFKDPKGCESDNTNDFIHSFKKKTIKKGEAFKADQFYYTLHTDQSNDLSVSVKFQECSSNKAGLCHCAVYIKSGNDFSLESKYAFVDFCDANPSINSHLKFYSTRSNIDFRELSLSTSFDAINCTAQINDVHDENEWFSLIPTSGVFKCAKLKNSDSNCETSFLKATYDRRSVVVKLDTKCTVPADEEGKSREEYLKNIMVIPDKNLTYVTGGLCGNMAKNKCHLFTQSIATITNNDCVTDSKPLGNYWITNQTMHLSQTLSMPKTNVDCSTFNYDSSLAGFGSTMLKDKNFNQINNSFVLYDHNLHTLVTSKYSLCKAPYKNVLVCNCGVYVRLNRTTTTHFAFIDVCALDSDQVNIQTFSYYDQETAKDLPYRNIDCSQVIDDEDSESEWENVTVSFGHFKCAKLRDDACSTFVLKTVGDEFSNIKVKVETHCEGFVGSDPISQISVYPSVRSEDLSTGLCGKWTQRTDQVCESNLEDGSDSCETTESTYNQTQRFNIHSYEDSGLIAKNINQALPQVFNITKGRVIDYSKICVSADDPHMINFNGRPYEFQHDKDYVLYLVDNRIRVVSAFQQCGSTIRCNCAIYMTTDPGLANERTVYIDFCTETPFIASNLNNPGTRLDQSVLDKYCATNTNNALKDETWNNWNYLDRNIIPIQNTFRCIKSSNKVYLRVYRESQNEKFEVMVELTLGVNRIPVVRLFPSFNNTGKTEGLCGEYGGTCSLYYIEDGEKKCIQNELSPGFDKYIEYWRMSDRFTRAKPNQALKIDPQVQENSVKNAEALMRVEAEMFPKTLLKNANEEDARIFCEHAINVNNVVRLVSPGTRINEELEMLRLEKIRLCILDVMSTGDLDWAQAHAQILKSNIIDQVLKDRSNFDENLVVKDETLEKYMITCPNDCTGQRYGKCVKNQNCRYDTGCEYVVKCECKSPYGSSDCSVNMKQAPTFTLAQKCCDSRSMNCDTITATGSFSDTDDIRVKLVLETDSSVAFDMQAEVINSQQIRIKFPYGRFPSIRESHKRIKIGLRYEMSDFAWQTVDFYDSRCRTCDEKNGVDEQPIQDTCISQQGVCSYMIADYEAIISGNPDATTCYDPSPCNSVFDVAFILHSSDSLDEKKFETMKESIAEMTGRFDLGPDRVHVGYMYYGHRTRKTMTLDTREQQKRKITIDRATQIPFIPLAGSPVSRALQFALDTIFIKTRSTPITYPRVAVLLNQKEGDDGDASVSAQTIKNKNIELVTIGIGDNINADTLNHLASSAPVLVNEERQAVTQMRKNSFFYKYPSDLFKNMQELVQRICTFNARVKMNEPSRIDFQNRFDKNYFQVDIEPVASESYVLVTIKENTGYANFYCSYTNPNPVLSDSCSANRRHARSESSFLIDMPSSRQTLYFTVENLGTKGEFEIFIETF